MSPAAADRGSPPPVPGGLSVHHRPEVPDGGGVLRKPVVPALPLQPLEVLDTAGKQHGIKWRVPLVAQGWNNRGNKNNHFVANGLL